MYGPEQARDVHDRDSPMAYGAHGGCASRKLKSVKKLDY
jgi:hypothetical protein